MGEMGWEWLSHTDTRKYTVGEGHSVGEMGWGWLSPESTLVEKVTVWVKWGGAGCHQKVHWWRQRYVTMRTKGMSGMGCFLKTQARKIPVSISEYTGEDIGYVTMWMKGKSVTI